MRIPQLLQLSTLTIPTSLRHRATYPLRRLEICLALLLAFCFGYTATVSAAQVQLSQQVLRLHVVANSNTAADQAVKLVVRDAVLDYLTPLLAAATDQTAVRALVSAELPTLAQVAQDTLTAQGIAQQVTAQISVESYPTRMYSDDYALPAGQYVGLRIALGSGTGENWWCVIYPPLCGEVATSGVDTAQTALNNPVTVRFQIAEWLGEIMENGKCKMENGKLW